MKKNDSGDRLASTLRTLMDMPAHSTRRVPESKAAADLANALARIRHVASNGSEGDAVVLSRDEADAILSRLRKLEEQANPE